MQKDAVIYVAGHTGMVGSAIVRILKQAGYHNLVYRTSQELDLRDQRATLAFMDKAKPEYVFFAAGKVGGILANKSQKGAFFYDNVMMQTNVIHAAHLNGVKKLLFLGSSCIYPKHCPQPIKESYLMTGNLEPTNDAYAVAKISGIAMCKAYREQYGCNFIAAMPTNLYGPGDNYDLAHAHVLPALLRKFHEAKINGNQSVTIWGSGSPKREFLYVEDLAKACLFLMQNYNEAEHINIGSGMELSILELAQMIRKIVGYKGDIVMDPSKPDGTPRKLLDISRILQLGWQAQTSLEAGIRQTYHAYQNVE